MLLPAEPQLGQWQVRMSQLSGRLYKHIWGWVKTSYSHMRVSVNGDTPSSLDGLFHGKSIYKWMITRARGTPMIQETVHMGMNIHSPAVYSDREPGFSTHLTGLNWWSRSTKHGVGSRMKTYCLLVVWNIFYFP